MQHGHYKEVQDHNYEDDEKAGLVVEIYACLRAVGKVRLVRELAVCSVEVLIHESLYWDEVESADCYFLDD